MWCASWGCTTPAGAPEPYTLISRLSDACQRAAPLARCARSVCSHAASWGTFHSLRWMASAFCGSSLGKRGGCPDTVAVVRRGAHTFFLRTGEVPRWGGYTVNLIHYEDAASLSAAVRASLNNANICSG